ncbi:unnamed protein product, partial [Phaeothamnion confervicola]
MKRFLIVFMLLNGCTAPPHDDFDAIEASEAARKWLTEIDRGQVEKAWAETSQLFQKTAPDGARQLGLSRDETGLPRDRTEKSKRVTQSLPGLPAGSYTVVEFETRFARESYTETAILCQEGNWKIVGYFMR